MTAIDSAAVPLKFTKVTYVTVDEHSVGQRLDNFLLTYLKGLPKSAVYKIIRKGEVRINKGRAKAETRLKIADEIRIPPVRLSEEAAQEVPLYFQQKLVDAIIFEDAALLVINKPSGIAVHKGSGIEYGVIEGLRAARPELQFLELVHRLDRDTSGCLVLAKTGVALRELQKCQMDKRYLCLVQNRWRKGKFDQKAPLDTEHREHGERHVVVSDKGKSAHTRFNAVQDFLGTSLIEAQLMTGRTHQIRVHAAHSGHPLAGDERYGNATFNQELYRYGLTRLFLHAHYLAFEILNKSYALSAPLAEDLSQVIHQLEHNLERKQAKRH